LFNDFFLLSLLFSLLDIIKQFCQPSVHQRRTEEHEQSIENLEKAGRAPSRTRALLPKILSKSQRPVTIPAPELLQQVNKLSCFASPTSSFLSLLTLSLSLFVIHPLRISNSTP
jgi:hypothetical protein